MINNVYFNNLLSFENYFNNNLHTIFSFVSINMRSISSITKFNKFKSIIAKLPRLPNIIAIQETWFHKDLVQLYNISGYNAIHSCRSDGYGGTSIFINNNLKYKIKVCESKNYIDCIVLSLTFYRSQKCETNRFLEHLEIMLRCLSQYPCVFAGDSNIDILNQHQSEELVNLLNSFNFVNCHNMITRPCSNTCIDHVYSNLESVECKLSDHNIISCRLDIKTPNYSFRQVTYRYCNFNSVKRFIQNNIPLENVYHHPSTGTAALISLIQTAIKNATTEKNLKRACKNEITPWVNGNLQKLINYKKRLLKVRKKMHGDLDFEELLKKISRVIKKACKQSMNDFFMNNLEIIKHDPKKAWKFINETLGRATRQSVKVNNDNGDEIISDKKKAEILNDFFLQSVADSRSQIQYSQGDFFNSLRTLNQYRAIFNFNITTQEEVENTILDLKPNKSCGVDNISSKVLLNCTNELAPHFVNIFNNIIKTNTYPDILKVHKITPIPKKKCVNASNAQTYSCIISHQQRLRKTYV